MEFLSTLKIVSFRTLVSCVDNPHSYKPYAPWIMALCNYSREAPFPASCHLKIFTPLRDVLNIAARPNDVFAEYVGPREHVNEKNIRKNFIKPVNHMEVSLRSQQMLQH